MNVEQNSIQTYLDRCRGIIARHGHLVQYVGAVPYGYAYTAGLTPSIGCELVVVALPQPAAHSIINDLVARLKKAPIADNEPIEELANMPLILRTIPLVDPASGLDRNELISVARRLGYLPHYVRQLVWPDKQGKFPGDPAYSHAVAQDVDLLLSTPTTKAH